MFFFRLKVSVSSVERKNVHACSFSCFSCNYVIRYRYVNAIKNSNIIYKIVFLMNSLVSNHHQNGVDF